MILYLTSSPCVIGADRAILNPDNSFVVNLKKDISSRANCLYIASDPFAQEANSRYCQDMYFAFSEAGICFREMKVLQSVNALDTSRLVGWSDVVILAGGHVPTQNRFFEEIALCKMLMDYPGVVIGISAGSMNCASMVYAQPEREGESVDPGYQRFISGLGLTDFNILPHYQQVKKYWLDGKRLYEDITFTDSKAHCFLVLPDGSYVRQTSKDAILYGLAYRLQDGNMFQICGPGEMTVIQF